MIDRSTTSRNLLLLGVALLVAALGVVGWLLVRTERRMALLEAHLAREEAQLARTAGAPRQAEPPDAPPARRWAAPRVDAPATAEAPPQRRAAAANELRAPAQPKLPAARRFAEDHELSEIQWRTLTRLNAYWMESVEKAANDGEDALPDKLDYIAKQRAMKLESVLGSAEAVTDYRDFEGSLKDNRVNFTAKDGKVYGAAPFE